MHCAVCGTRCRGKCEKCGASLCATHKPTNMRVGCAVYKPGTALIHATPTIAPYPHPTQRMVQTITPQHPLAALVLADQLAWIDARRLQLLKKQARERAYLDRRAVRGTHTPTDDAYGADSILESELLEALDLLMQCLQRSVSTSISSGSTSTYAVDTSILFPMPGSHDKLQP